MRSSFYGSTVCYLINNDKVLMLKFHKKWGQVYSGPGGKIESHETPLECIKREFKEETGLVIDDPKLKGISYWQDNKSEGIIFVFIATNYQGTLINDSNEGSIEWINISELNNIKQFPMNEKFKDYLFKENLFEGKFTYDDNGTIIEYQIKEI